MIIAGGVSFVVGAIAFAITFMRRGFRNVTPAVQTIADINNAELMGGWLDPDFGSHHPSAHVSAETLSATWPPV